jgi:hypothetical protein
MRRMVVGAAVQPPLRGDPSTTLRVVPLPEQSPGRIFSPSHPTFPARSQSATIFP